MNEREHPASQPTANSPAPKLLNAEELVQRLAIDLRAKGDPDLPLSFYTDQARQLLLHGSSALKPANNANNSRACNDQLYQAWALGKM